MGSYGGRLGLACPEQVNLDEVDHMSFVTKSRAAGVGLWSVHNWCLFFGRDDFMSKVATKDTIRKRQNTRASFRDSEKYSPVPSGCGGEGVGLVDKVELREY